ncbi:MAG: NADH-quinone oxidoreductase subunit NuoG [Deltaproteobacteria bacterium]|nr:NADH-quinone oxidoreductase subunit NuoG [Deltaproteobacteria bacterium]
MPRLIIDDREVEVPEGTKVMEAAERLGIMIPRFCYHEALGSVGACRLCAVKFIEGHRKGIDMSCMVAVKDGMVVSTTHPEAVAFRKFIIECLMLNHPHDCPVCDEGGHCLLQDETVSGGHGRRRYSDKKRTYEDQDLGPFVQHEMNRCIHCFRCRRFYQEFSGYRDLGVMQIGHREYFGRFEDGPLESPFSGNLIDICPTGVYTDKPARFKGRRWNFERSPSLCLHCSLGCNTTGSARYREMVRLEARQNTKVNNHFICDRGRFGFDFANHVDRPRTARVGKKPVSWKEGIETAARRLKGTDPLKVLSVGSERCSLEAQWSLKQMCRNLDWPGPRFFMEPDVQQKVKTAVDLLDETLAISMGELESSDFILALGVDPVNEAPMLALAMRQAHRKGATVVVMDPRPVSLPFVFAHLPVTPDYMDLCAQVLVQKAFDPGSAGNLSDEAAHVFAALPNTYTPDPDLQERLKDLGQRLGESLKPVVVCGTDVVRPRTPGLAEHLARLLGEKVDGARLFYVLPGPNAFGAGLLSPNAEQEPVLDILESGNIEALILVEQDPFWSYPDRERLENALEKVECLIVLDYLPSVAVDKAQMVLPTCTHFERSSASFINQEGRLQRTSPVYRGGTPISQVSEGKHPPRTFLDYIPGGDPKAAHDVLAELYGAISGEKEDALLNGLEDWLEQKDVGLRCLSHQKDGIRVVPEIGSEEGVFSKDLELLLTHRTFGTEELSAHSRPAIKGESTPKLMMHPEDAGRLKLADKDRIALSLDRGEVVVELQIASNMARGVIILPRHRRLEWQKLKQWPAVVPDDGIRKIEEPK